MKPLLEAPARWRAPATRLDATNVEATRRELLAEAAAAPALTIDLTGVVYVDALGLECLLEAVRRCRGPATFVGVSASVRDFLRRCDVLPLLRVQPDVPLAEQ